MAGNEDTQNTLKERATELFSLCDQDGKGFITQHDLVGVINELGLPLDSTQVKQAFTKLDDDQNGFLTLDEFTAGFGLFLGLDIADGNHNNGDLEDIVNSDPGQELFYLCDSDRKGYITKTDLQRVALDLNLNFDQLDLIFDKLDQDGNGKLTLDEFAVGFGKFLGGLGSEDEGPEYTEDDDSIDVDAIEEYEHNNDVFENISSQVGSPSYRDDAMFSEVVDTVGEDVLSGGALSKDQLRELWESLQQNDTRALQKFQDFLVKISTEIRRSRTESEQLETALKSKMNSHDAEVQKLYEEMEQQIKSVKDSYVMEQQKREKQIKSELLSELEHKEAEIHWMLNKQKKLEEAIQRKEKGEQDVKSENEKLLEKNWYLEEKLNDSVTSLEDTKSYVHQLQAMTAEEKKERARAAYRVTEGMQKEQQSLVEQLDMLREINQKLRDDRDAIEAAHQAMLMTKRERGSSLSDEIEEAESKHKKVNRQGSQMSKYFERKTRRIPASPVSPQSGQQGSFESITEERGSDSDDRRTSDDRKVRRRSSKRSRRMKKQGAVNYYNTSGSTNDGLSLGSTSSETAAMDLSALNREVEFEGDMELGKIVDDKPPQPPVWAMKIMAAYDEAEKAKKDKEEEEFRQKKAELLSGRSTEDEKSPHSDALYSSSEFESDSSCPQSPRTAPVGKDDDPSFVMESSTQLVVSPQVTNPERVFKVVFIGDSGVGKSSFIHRFCHDQWKPSFTATIGVDFQIKTMMANGQCIAIQLWDTAGQERFRSITKQYFRKADGILIFYDVTAESSFISLKSWMLSVEEGAEEGAALMLLCNKTDLIEDEEKRVVKKEDGKNLANQYNALYMETSAKTGDGIQEAMSKLADVLQTREDQMMQSVLNLVNTPNKKKKKCCKS